MEQATTTSLPLSAANQASASNEAWVHPSPPLYRRGPSGIRIARTLLGGLLALLLLVLVGLIALYAYIAWVLARPHVAPLQSNPLAAVQLPYEDVTFTAQSGTHSLEGWYIPAETPSRRTIVFSHGYGGNREEIWVPIYELAQFANRAGYNALMFDYGYVYHDDRVVTGGAQESGDLLGAVQYAIERGADEVVVWGFSMGAGTALQAALRTDAIDAMILDSTFVLEPDTLYHNLHQVAPKLPKEPSITLLRWLYPLLNGSGLQDVPYQDIQSTAYDIPIFMIHGTRDERSPHDMINGIAANQKTSGASDYWLVPNATHELIYRADKEEYASRVAAFLRRIAPASGI